MSKKVSYSKFNSFKNFLNNRYRNSYFFNLCFGSKGAGKTTILAKAYLEAVKSNKYSAIYTNVDFVPIKGSQTPLYFLDLNQYQLTDYFHRCGKWAKYRCYTNPTTRKLDDTKFKIMENSLIILDEIGILYLNRNYKSFDTHITNFFKVHRHLRIDIIANSQSYDIDKCLRNATTELSLCRKRGLFCVQKTIDKSIGVGTDENSMNADTCIYDKISFRKFYKRGAFKLTFIPFYLNLFDSFG